MLLGRREECAMIPDIPIKYLSGTEINNNGKIYFGDEIFDLYRENAIRRIITKDGDDTSANVIHLGACDHQNLIKEKIRRNVWLHKILTENAAHCVGFDVDAESVAYCNSIGWENIYWLDMIHEYERVYEIIKHVGKWDYLIAGEIVEHLDNPVEFLEKLHHRYIRYVDKIVITVPNAYSIHYLDSVLHGIEGINTDHRYWFTPYTICKIAHRAGFSLREMLYTGTRNLQLNNQNYHFENSLISNNIILIADF